MKKVRWVLAHEPIELFLRAARKFAHMMEMLDPGYLEVEILTLSEYADKYNDGVAISKHDILQLMKDGKIEMSQMYTSTLGREHNTDLRVLDMPYLFRDHEHAQKVLEGDIGRELLSGLDDEAKGHRSVHGLAFTYSGGFRMIPANKKIEKIEDFQGLPLRCNNSDIAKETLKAVGAVPVPIELEQINEGVQDGDIIGGESTYPRFFGLKQNECMNTINDAEHSLFLTTIIAEKDFWTSLPREKRLHIKRASILAARAERIWSVEDIDVVKSKCVDENIEVVTMSDSERARFKEATLPLYDQFKDSFPAGMVDRIRAEEGCGMEFGLDDDDC
jgi:C4-dicarboxylate-binding protein DctP|tara:strand:- start:3020 stop:4015 length:996 start_codon:yes stop_codon:yes gene_type:complete